MSFAKQAKALSFKQRLIDKSVWKFTEDVTLVTMVTNPAYLIWQQTHSNYVTTHGAVQAWKIAGPNPSIQIEHHILCKKDDVFTVVGKHSKQWVGQKLEDALNLKIDKNQYETFLHVLKGKVELISSPEVFIWVLRDTVTGLFYKTASYEYNTTVPGTATVDHYPIMVAKLTQAKKCTDIGKVKSAILSFSGYFDGLPDSTDMPDWMGGPKLFDLPKTWEAVKIDKISKKELETVDIQEWYKNTWRLRPLTVNYGSSVRKVFSAIEKKVDKSFKGLLLFKTCEITETNGTYFWIDKPDLSDKQKKEIDEAIKHASVKKGDYIRQIDGTSVCVAFQNAGMALIAKMAYTGTLIPVALNIETLKEVID